MAVVTSNLGSEWGLKKLFVQEIEEEKHAAAAKAKESATSKVLHEGVRQLYPCLCYPKELLKKEDEERNGPHYEEVLPKGFKIWAIKQKCDKEVLPKMLNGWAFLRRYVEEVELRKMFIAWASKHGKRYDTFHEWRLRYKIWLNTKERKEQLWSLSGQTFSVNEMTDCADLTKIEPMLGIRGGAKPSELKLSDVKKRLLGTMGESWMEKEREGFDEWAERHKRVYSSTEEREKRLLAYLFNMSSIHLWDELSPGDWEHGTDLENMDKFPWEAELIPKVKCSRCRPGKQPSGQTSSMNQTCTAADKKVANCKDRDKSSNRIRELRMMKESMMRESRMENMAMNQMSMAADKTVTEIIPDVFLLWDVKKKILDTVVESWMKETAEEFEMWAARHKKVYENIKERAKMRLGCMENMRKIDLNEKYGNDLENMGRLDWEAKLIPATSSCK